MTSKKTPTSEGPARGSRPLAVFLLPEELEALQIHAEDEGVTAQAILRRALRSYLSGLRQVDQ